MQEQQSEYQIVIDATGMQKEYLKDLFRYRELFYFLAWRDILVRYKQAFFGIAWALVRPLLNMLVFAFVFGKIAHLSSGNVNYPLFVLAGMLPWQLFASASIDTCNCLVNNAHLVSKVYFPRMIIPASEIIVHLVDFCVTAILLLTLASFFGDLNFQTIFAFPIFTILLLTLCLGMGFWLSALTVQYRDFRLLIPFVIQFGLFISPVGYGTFVIPEKWQWLYILNPLVGIIDGFRWSLFGMSHNLIFYSIAYSTIFTSFLLITGFFYFKKTERSFADNI